MAGLLIILTTLTTPEISAVYSRTQTYTPIDGFFGGSTGNTPAQFDRSMCQAGQDFILQIDPLGCTNVPVRSDLLEEQDVPVFCPIVATKINPLIDVNFIDHIRITGQYPNGVSGVGFLAP
ncbi:MAG: hypothetical protein WD876_02980, partial [Candidatus Pacearchaeota archaeon]